MAVQLENENFSPVRRTIKNNDIFLVTDANGNVLSNNISGYGLYLSDTRFLSRLECKLNNSYPIVLSSSTETGHSSVVIGTNLKLRDNTDPDKIIPQESIQIKRESIIYGSYFETITIANYNLFEVGIRLELFFEADFLDIFEVRNIKNFDHQNNLKPLVNNNKLKFVYNDSTGAKQETEIVFVEEQPTEITEEKIVYEFVLPPTHSKKVKYKINLKSTAMLPEKINASDFDDAFDKAVSSTSVWSENTSSFLADNDDFNEMLQRGHKDMQMLVTKAVYGDYVAAGIPWYTTLFGRDSIIAAKQCLMLMPEMSKSVLQTLAKFQGKEENDWRDEEPGKILHEIRFGELARANKIPHSPYFGTVDATPLWVILLYDYFIWTNDVDTLESLWPNALACLNWMDNYGMYNGFAAYKKKSDEGLDNQSWKDSWDSYMHKNGELAEPPIASVEVQGYFYSAKIKMAKLAAILNNNELSKKLVKEAQEFKERFHKAFWMEDLQYYALALDKYGNQLKVVSSNPGHLIETGIVDLPYAEKIANRIMEPDMFTGWGIRTLSSNCISFNPMSYHNGSIWPHDNSMIAAGMAKIGKNEHVIKITSALFEAARLMHYKRLPELFCGFERVFHRQDPPVSYPVACIPQAWAAGSVFYLVQSMLNIEADARNNRLKILNPSLPDWVNVLEIKNLNIGNSRTSVEFRKTSRGLVIDVYDKCRNLDILIKK